jgi:hypothetical protein
MDGEIACGRATPGPSATANDDAAAADDDYDDDDEEGADDGDGDGLAASGACADGDGADGDGDGEEDADARDGARWARLGIGGRDYQIQVGRGKAQRAPRGAAPRLVRAAWMRRVDGGLRSLATRARFFGRCVLFVSLHVVRMLRWSLVRACRRWSVRARARGLSQVRVGGRMDAEVLQGSVDDDSSLLDTVHDLHAEVRRVGAVSHAALTAAVRGRGRVPEHRRTRADNRRKGYG